MGRMKWTLTLLAVATLSAGGPQGFAGCNSCDVGPAAGLGAQACCGPMFGTQPGCCECPPSACDNAWDGFCQEKLKWKQLWHKVGTGYWVPPRCRYAAYPTADGLEQRTYEVLEASTTLPDARRRDRSPQSEAPLEPVPLAPEPAPEPEAAGDTLQPAEPEPPPERLPGEGTGQTPSDLDPPQPSTGPAPGGEQAVAPDEPGEKRSQTDWHLSLPENW